VGILNLDTIKSSPYDRPRRPRRE